MLGVRCVDLRTDGACVEVAAREEHRNPDGHISGAVIAGAADLAAGIAVTAANEGRDSATGELSLHFLAPARQSPLRLEVEVLRRGRRTCVPHVRVYEATGRLCAVATGTWLLRDSRVVVNRGCGRSARRGSEP
jgi:uncharacterized protein (TIGR00369 family)